MTVFAEELFADATVEPSGVSKGQNRCSGLITINVQEDLMSLFMEAMAGYRGGRKVNKKRTGRTMAMPHKRVTTPPARRLKVEGLISPDKEPNERRTKAQNQNRTNGPNSPMLKDRGIFLVAL